MINFSSETLLFPAFLKYGLPLKEFDINFHSHEGESLKMANFFAMTIDLRLKISSFLRLKKVF